MPSAATKKTALARKNLVTHLVLAVGLFLLGAVAWAFTPQPVAKVALHGRTFHLTVAGDEMTRERGLGGARTLASGSGMLFIFGSDGIWRFWMKDMHHNLDIIWLNSKKEVLYVVHNAAASSYPKVFTPSQESRYVIEVPAGDATDVVPGDVAAF